MNSRSESQFGNFTPEAQIFLSQLNPTQQKIILLVNDNYQAQIANKLHIDPAYVSRFLKRLKELGLIEEDSIKYEDRGKVCTISRRAVLTNKTKFHNCSPYLQEFIADLETKRKQDYLLYDIHNISLFYRVKEKPKSLFLNESPLHPEVRHVKKWHPNGVTMHKFHVQVSERITISIICHGSSIRASRIRSSERIEASDHKELEKKWKRDVEDGVAKFIQYQKNHGRKILTGKPERRGEPHYSFYTKDGEKVVSRLNPSLPGGIYIDNSPKKHQRGLAEIETKDNEIAGKIDRGLRNALRFSDMDTIVQRHEKEIAELSGLRPSYEKLSEENAFLRARLDLVEQSLQKLQVILKKTLD